METRTAGVTGYYAAEQDDAAQRLLDRDIDS